MRRAKAPAKHIAIVALNAAIAALAGKGAQPDYLMGDLFPGNVDYHVLRIRIQQDSRPVHITRLRANISRDLLRVPTSQRLHIRQPLPQILILQLLLVLVGIEPFIQFHLFLQRFIQLFLHVEVFL